MSPKPKFMLWPEAGLVTFSDAESGSGASLVSAAILKLNSSLSSHSLPLRVLVNKSSVSKDLEAGL